MDALVLGLIVGGVFVATLVQSTIGFGMALIAMPLITLLSDVQTATAIVGLSSYVGNLIIAFSSRRMIDIASAWRLVLAAWVGVPLGLLLLTQASTEIVQRILGTLLILFGLYRLLVIQLPAIVTPRLAYPLGFLSGLFGGAFNINGPPVVIYGTLQRWPPEQFRATIQGFFAATGFGIVLGHSWAGLWTPDVLMAFASALPLIVIAVLLGGRLNRHFDPERFTRTVYGFILIMGLVLFL